jgi:hypothetical protein
VRGVDHETDCVEYEKVEDGIRNLPPRSGRSILDFSSVNIAFSIHGHDVGQGQAATDEGNRRSAKISSGAGISQAYLVENRMVTDKLFVTIWYHIWQWRIQSGKSVTSQKSVSVRTAERRALLGDHFCMSLSLAQLTPFTRTSHHTLFPPLSSPSPSSPHGRLHPPPSHFHRNRHHILQ